MANEVHRKYLTPIVFRDSGGDVAFTLQGLAAATGRRSASTDLPAGTDGVDVELDMTQGWETAPAVGGTDQVELYINEYGQEASAGTGSMDDGNSDGALSSTNKLVNADPVLIIRADEAAADIPIARRKRLRDLVSDHVAVIVYNRAAADALQNTANTTIVRLYPWVYEIQ